jgi:L-ascorbate metabolism protein UlaG (beta-lactamase superfamily)
MTVIGAKRVTLAAFRCALLCWFALLAGCVRLPPTHLGSLNARDYSSTDLGAYRGCFAAEYDFGSAPSALLTVTFLGTTSLLFDDGADQIMIDGFVSRPAVHALVFKKIESDWSEIERVLEAIRARRVGGVFVAHAHYDHAFDSAHVAKWTGARLYGSPSVLNLGHGAGLPVGQLLPLRPQSEVEVGAFRIVALPSVHSLPDWYNNNLGQEIALPMSQPLRARDMVEGGSFDLLIRHRNRTILIRPAAGYRAGDLAGVTADILFLAVGSLGNQTPSYRRAFFEETVGRVGPRLVVPTHWDSPFRDLGEPLRGTPEAIDNVRVGLDAVIEPARGRDIEVLMLNGLQRIPLDGHFRDAPGNAPRARTVGECPPRR